MSEAASRHDIELDAMPMRSEMITLLLLMMMMMTMLIILRLLATVAQEQVKALTQL